MDPAPDPTADAFLALVQEHSPEQKRALFRCMQRMAAGGSIRAAAIEYWISCGMGPQDAKYRAAVQFGSGGEVPSRPSWPRDGRPQRPEADCDQPRLSSRPGRKLGRHRRTSTMPTPPLMTVNAVADQLDCNPETVRRAIRAGTLACYRFGGVLRISPDHLQAYMDASLCPARDPLQEAPAAALGDVTTKNASGDSCRQHRLRKAASGRR